MRSQRPLSQMTTKFCGLSTICPFIGPSPLPIYRSYHAPLSLSYTPLHIQSHRFPYLSFHILLLLLLSKLVQPSSHLPFFHQNNHRHHLLLMDKAERETHDFMNVESFSQLPFIRPAPVKEKGIRLFGIEFGGGGGSDTAAVTDESEYSGEITTACEEAKGSGGGSNDSNGGESSSRKFECHYCCRNFPTSQALGGHQNAHKRERQHAKRAHLQSAMVHSSGAFSDAQLYGFMNYGGRLGSAPTPATTYHHHQHSWNPNTSSNNTTPPRFYGSSNNIHASYSHHHHHHQSPINGNPLALWRIPAVQNSPNLINRDRSIHHPLPLLANDELKPSQPLIGGAGSSQSRYVYEAAKSSVQDHVSLDLHL